MEGCQEVWVSPGARHLRSADLRWSVQAEGWPEWEALGGGDWAHGWAFGCWRGVWV